MKNSPEENNKRILFDEEGEEISLLISWKESVMAKRMDGKVALLTRRSQKWIGRASAVVPLRKPGDPEDVGYMVLFLASDEAKYITGQHFSVNGGTSMC